MSRFMIVILAVLLSACTESPAPAESASQAAESPAVQPAPPVVQDSSEILAAALAAQPEDVQARYMYRHPQETLEFIGIEPGMTVYETLPGGGWYSKVLLAYLGSEGQLIGADYAADMYPLFGFFSDEALASKATWVETWSAEADDWRNDDSASVSAFQMGSMPAQLQGTADAAIVVRTLHNLARFEPEGGYLTAALADLYAILKPGGIVGVVQHQARDEMPDEWASGANGYLKDDFVIAHMTAAGFEYAGQSGINFNPKDQPGEDDFVWRLPPSLATSQDNAELKAAMLEIGESHRMTIKFRKPGKE
ncbi:MAG: class I SAM-dependent methyltransferase [Gammaproteobacteria bacterium]|nr:class I SAM-dependent methyltransferase [Gammaproteobacteria bacterium]